MCNHASNILDGEPVPPLTFTEVCRHLQDVTEVVLCNLLCRCVIGMLQMFGANSYDVVHGCKLVEYIRG